MTRLRRQPFLARFMLAWLLLVIGANGALRIAAPAPLDLVCSGGGGIKMMAAGGEEGQPAARTALDCPLCAAIAPPLVPAPWPQTRPHGQSLQPIPSARIAALPVAALPARGPPATA